MCGLMLVTEIQKAHTLFPQFTTNIHRGGQHAFGAKMTNVLQNENKNQRKQNNLKLKKT